MFLLISSKSVLIELVVCVYFKVVMKNFTGLVNRSHGIANSSR